MRIIIRTALSLMDGTKDRTNDRFVAQFYGNKYRKYLVSHSSAIRATNLKSKNVQVDFWPWR